MTPNKAATPGPLVLRPEHAARLAQFRIPPEILESAGVRSVTDAESRETLGLNGHREADLSGILFPYLSPLTGARVGARVRLDHLLLDDGGKYISELECRHLFFPPNVANFLHDLKVPVVIVEAENSALALRALADRASRPMLPIAVGGCWGWRRKIGKRAMPDGSSEPETGPAPDLDLIAWRGRTVFLAFDSNAATNHQVRIARRALAKELSRRGARVLIAEVPTLRGVNGPDDLIALHGDDAMLRALDCERENETAPYVIKDGRLCVEKMTQSGLVVSPLCNFTAKIEEELILDDGAETARAFTIQGNLDTGEPLAAVRVPAARFAGMAWVTDSWGVRAVVRAGLAVRDQLREAIQKLSADALRHHVYTHTGWRNIDGEWLYFTASGAIGRDGFRDGFEIDLGPDLAHYSLPRVVKDPRGAMLASLHLLDIAPLTVTAPLWAAIFRAPLASACSLDTSIWLEGPTGSLKSTLAGLFNSHFGAFDLLHLPGTWSSTANQLERGAFVLKDAPFVVDDYTPNPLDAREQQAKAARLLRSQGNLAGRGRLRSDLSERPSYPPRGIVISTGEQHPPGQSLLARILVTEIQRSQINLSLLTEAQRNADRLPHAMAGYIAWLAEQYPTLPPLLKKTFEGARHLATVGGEHLRVPGMLAHLWVGLVCALTYAEEVGACTYEEAESLRKRCWATFLTLGRAQARLVECERPSRRFLEVIAGLLAQHEVLLVTKEDSGQALRGDTQIVGWYDDDFAYLLPEAAFSAVARSCRDCGEPFPIRQERLMRDLANEGLSECNTDRHTRMARVGGWNRRTLCLIRAKIREILGEDLPCGVSAVPGVSGSGE